MDNFPEQNIIGGRNPVSEAFKSDISVEKLVVSEGDRDGSVLKLIGIAKSRGIPVVTADRRALDRMCPGIAHQGVAALITEKTFCEISDIMEIAKQRGEQPFIIIADEICDPHNLGAIIRTADACGAHGLIVPKRRSSGFTPTVYKSSAGAAAHIAVARVTNITAAVKELKDLGVWIFGTDGGGSTLYCDGDYNRPLALIAGSEGDGMRSLVTKNCDYLLKIPMRGKVTSLNVSAACAVVMYEISKQRGWSI